MNVYDGTLEKLKRYGWCKGTFQDKEGRVCLFRALTLMPMVQRQLGSIVLLREVVEEFTDFQGPNAITHFNDDPATTFEDIRAVLEKASARLDELGGFKPSVGTE